MNTAVLFALVVASWGLNPYAISLQLGPVAPEVLVAYRFAASGVLVVAAALALRRSLRFTLREHLYLALQGVLMFSLVDLLFYHAIVHIPSGLVQLVVSMMIVTNILLGALLLGLPVRRHVVVGAAMGIAGVAMVSWPEFRDMELDGGGPLGMAMAVAAMLAGSLASIAAARNLRAGLPVLETTGICMLYGAACSLAVAVALGRAFAWDWSPLFLGAFAWVAVPGSAVGFVLFIALIGRIGPDRAAYSILLLPIVALGISTALEGFTWTPLSVVGAVAVLAGNFVVLSRLRRPPLMPVAVGATTADRGAEG